MTEALLTPPEGTVGQTIEEIRRHLQGMHRGEWNKLATTITSSASTLSITYAALGISRGSYIALDDELCYVWDVSGSNVTVERAMLGTTAAAHTAGVLIEVNPRFPKGHIREALKAEIRSWYPQLFYVNVMEVTAAGGLLVDLVPNAGAPYTVLNNLESFGSVLDVRREPRSTGETWPRLQWQLLRNMDPGVSGYGYNIQVQESLPAGTQLRVTFSAQFPTAAIANDANMMTTSAISTDTYVGIPVSALDIAAIGTAWRLVSTREVKRTQTEAQGEPRNAQEVPPGHITQVAAALKQIRDQRLAEEAKRFALLYSPKTTN